MARWFVDRFAQTGIPSVSLRQLLPGARFVGCPDLIVSGCSADSRRIEPGQVYIAIRGERTDGHDQIAKALDRGASGVVVDRFCESAGPVQIVVSDTRSAYGRICQALAGDPSRRLKLIAVSGLSSAETASVFLRSIFEASGRRYGYVGRDGWFDGRSRLPVAPPPWKPEVWARMLARMVENECEGAILLVSSETLENRLIEGVTLDRAVVTDLSTSSPVRGETLRLERMRHARLVRMVAPDGAAIVAADDPEVEILGGVNLEAERVTFGLFAPADYTAKIETADALGSRLIVKETNIESHVHLKLAGAGRLPAAVAAYAAARSSGVSIEPIVAGIEAVDRVPGRFEPIQEGQDFPVWIEAIDSTRDLKLAFRSMRAIVSGKIRCVLGPDVAATTAGRRSSARIAGRYADHLILTSDLLQTQSIDDWPTIWGSMFDSAATIEHEPRRAAAIEKAIDSAESTDGVLIVGARRAMHADFSTDAIGSSDFVVATRGLRRSATTRRRQTA